MSKEKIRELIICVITLVVLGLALTTNVFASDIDAALGNGVNYSEIPDGSSNNVVNNTVNNTINNTVNNTVSNNTSANNTAKNNTAIPYTGVDYSVIFIIGVCGISALYAYKKIKDYNNL